MTQPPGAIASPRLAFLIVVAFVSLSLAPGFAAADDFKFEPAYPSVALKGPQAAKGAVIWSHGINSILGKEDADSPTPVFIGLFRDDGWDVFRLNRARMIEEPRTTTEELVARVHRLKQQGYAKIVLAGQSGGAWISLMAAGRSDEIHAVIANAPAYYGTSRGSVSMEFQKNAFVLYDHIDRIRRGRIMISFFRDDAFDPGGRGVEADAILSRHDVPHLILDRPEELAGHGAGNSGLFMRRFGACALAVAGDGAVPRGECQSSWGREPSVQLELPADLTIAAPTPGAATNPFLGKWYGYYANGREVMLVIERAQDAEVEAVYAIGPGPDPATKASFARRKGRVSEGRLVFESSGLATLRYGVRSDGTLEGQWMAANGGSHLETALRRLP
jgi:pimeloyl-ACP methyl ester carboxylesterase